VIGYHVTTPKKFDRYEQTRVILPPVRFWIWPQSAINWAERIGRTIILKIEVSKAYPLPDHKPREHTYWSPNMITKWDRI